MNVVAFYKVTNRSTCYPRTASVHCLVYNAFHERLAATSLHKNAGDVRLARAAPEITRIG